MTNDPLTLYFRNNGITVATVVISNEGMQVSLDAAEVARCIADPELYTPNKIALGDALRDFLRDAGVISLRRASVHAAREQGQKLVESTGKP